MKRNRSTAVLGLLIVIMAAGCSLFGDDDDESTGGAGSAGTGAVYGYMVFGYFGASGTGYQTDLTLAADAASYESGLSPVFLAEFYDTTADAAIEAGTYEVAADAAAAGAASPGNVLTVRIIRGISVTLDGATVQELRFDYVGTNLSRPQLNSLYDEVRTPDIGEYQRITGGTVTVAESAGRYTFSWTLLTEDGESIVGSYEGAVDLEEDSST